VRALAPILLYAAPLILVELRRAIPGLVGLTEHAPDPVLLAVVFAALRFRPDGACLFAAAAGLLGDLPSGTPFGLGGARLALVAALVATLRRQIDTTAPFVPTLAVLGAGLLDRSLAAIVLDGAGEGGLVPGDAAASVPLLAVLAHGALDAFATLLLVPLLWPAGEALRAAASPKR
jgi:rod shape-determining protein MreD